MAIMQPQNKTIKDGSAQIQLKWNNTFAPRAKKTFTDTQKYVDSECINLMVPYTPIRNGILSKAAAIGTKIGSGEIHIVVPYGRYQYYGKLMVSSLTGSSYAKHGESKVITEKDLVYSTAKHPLAQRMWFETMKHNHKEQILMGAAALTRRK